MDIYFIRHGDPDYANDSLTELGHFQAEKTAEELSKIKFDQIYSSSMQRARQTAEHLTNKTNQNINSFDWAREDLTWKYMHDIDENGNEKWFFDIPKNSKILEKNRENLEWHKFFPSQIKEILDNDGKEIDEWLKSLNIIHKNGKYEIVGKTPERIAFFAHGGFGLVFYSHLLDVNYPDILFKYGQQDLCGVAHFQINKSGIQLISHNKIYY